MFSSINTRTFDVLGLLLIVTLFASSAPSSALAQSCDADVVEIEVPYFGPRDVVEDCLADANIPNWHCPTPFPEFPHTTDSSPSCEVAVVGAGTGGLYFAMRLVESGKVKGSDVCIFESTDRVGGRIYSLRGLGPKKDLSVDAGGYRTWPRYTPVTHELITNTLNLPMVCYEPEVPCQKFNIVDKNGNKDGFATLPEKLMERVMGHGARFFKNSELQGINKTLATDPVSVLFFKSGIVANAKHVVLGVPQRPLLQIVRNSNLPASEVNAGMFAAMHSVQSEIVTKLYLYYKDAWWLKLNLTVGDFSQTGDTQNMLLAGRYHDGHVNCDSTTKECHGFLMTVYANDYAGDKAQYFRRFQNDRGEPVTIISSAKSIEHKAFLDHSHDRLMSYHRSGMPFAIKAEKMGHLTTFAIERALSDAPKPDFAVLATWNIGTYGAGGGWHGWTNLAHESRALQPLNGAGIHVINEAFSKVQGWAEGSLQLADEVLKQHFDVESPWNFTVPNVIQRVRQTSATANCAAASSAAGGGAPSASAGGGGEDDHDCFLADTLVVMADGSRKPIQDVQEGDVVLTGGAGSGVVTKALVHPVDPSKSEFVNVVVLGGVQGTRSHPVLIDGEWTDFSALAGVTVERRPRSSVKNWYNLEVDAHAPHGDSLHSYVLEAADGTRVVASGLGDNAELNRRHLRQLAWKELVARELIAPPAVPAASSASCARQQLLHGGAAAAASGARVHGGSAFTSYGAA